MSSCSAFCNYAFGNMLQACMDVCEVVGVLTLGKLFQQIDFNPVNACLDIGFCKAIDCPAGAQCATVESLKMSEYVINAGDIVTVTMEYSVQQTFGPALIRFSVYNPQSGVLTLKEQQNIFSEVMTGGSGTLTLNWKWNTDDHSSSDSPRDLIFVAQIGEGFMDLKKPHNAVFNSKNVTVDMLPPNRHH